MARGKPTGHVHYQVRWIDLEPWLQQLEESHGVYCAVEVLLQGMPAGLQPAVRVTGYTLGVGKNRVEKFCEWKTFSLTAIGEVERWALHICSQALLILDSEAERAERQSTFV